MFDIFVVVLVIVVLSSIPTGLIRNSAVKGSYKRYVFATIHRVQAIFIIVGYSILAILESDSKNWGRALADIMVVAVWVLFEAITKDDDWFNKTRKKLKKWVKSTVERLAVGPEWVTV